MKLSLVALLPVACASLSYEIYDGSYTETEIGSYDGSFSEDLLSSDTGSYDGSYSDAFSEESSSYSYDFSTPPPPSPQVTVMLKYNLVDVTSNSLYPAGSTEYHCFDPDESGAYKFVRGTYGRFGYFEGMVDDQNPRVFHVNWFESSIDSASIGSATLNYTSDFTSVQGPYWSTSDIIGSYNKWHSIDGQLVDLTSAPWLRWKNCLYPGMHLSGPRSPRLFPLTIAGASSQGLNQFCRIPARPEDYIGAYKYVYDTGLEELGVYGPESRSFALSTGFGFAGSWHAQTGPYAGDRGTILYISQRNLQGESFIIGYFCTVDETSPGVFQRTECFTERYEGVELNGSDRLCPQLFGTDEENNFKIPLKRFAVQARALD